MDFSFDETQDAIRGLAKQILSDIVTEQSLVDIEKGEGSFHEAAWAALAKSELLGLALPEKYGGAGMGLIELCLLLQQVGRTVAPIPALGTLVLGALPIAEFGSESQKQRLLPGVCAGTGFVTGAFADPRSRNPRDPSTVARPSGAGWLLEGTLTGVEEAARSARIVVPARTPDGALIVCLVNPNSAGVQLKKQVATNYRELSELHLNGVEIPADDVLAGVEEGGRVVGWIVQRAILGVCALELGVAERALFMTAEYSTKREQFGQPIGAFQAVSQRCGDSYIDLQAMKLSLWQAAWRMENGLSCDRALAVAKFWASEGGHRIVAAAQHIHGGMGVDRDYGLHRYFLTSKALEFTMGGAHAHLHWLGRMLAAGVR